MKPHVYTLRLVKHTGMVVMWANKSEAVAGSPQQLRDFYGQVLRYNLLFGWWSYASIIVNPIILIQNYRTLKKLEELVRADQGTII